MTNISTYSVKHEQYGKIKTKIFHIKRILGFYIINKMNVLRNKSFKRTAKVTKNDYHLTNWKNIYNDKKWLQYDELIDFVLDNNSSTINNIQTSYLNDKICSITQSEYAQFRKYILNYHIEQHVKSSQTLVELGCGWGLNIWTLLANNKQRRIEGYELSENGLKSCKEINDHFKCNVYFKNIDLTDLSTFPSFRKKIIYTYHVLEQLKYDSEIVIENILKSKPDMVLHFEPVPELYKNSDHEKLVKQYIKFRDYQDNLLSTLKRFEKDEKIIIVEAKRLYFAANPLYETCFIKWIPNNS